MSALIVDLGFCKGERCLFGLFAGCENSVSFVWTVGDVCPILNKNAVANPSVIFQFVQDAFYGEPAIVLDDIFSHG